MDIFTGNDLRTLVEMRSGGCLSVSIYMPTHRAGSDRVRENPTRLKKLLRQAHEELVKAGIRHSEADMYLQPAQDLVDDGYFWMYAGDGLAIFVSRDHFRYYRLPASFPEMAVAGDRFHVKPLIPVLSFDGRFYVLSLSQKKVRLLLCTRHGFAEINLSGKVPASVAEALKYDDFDREQQFHAHERPTGDAKIIFGHGPGVKDTKQNLLRFFYLVDKGLRRDILQTESAPLILAGVEYLLPIYREANTYRNLLDKEAPGNPDKLGAAELHRIGLAIAEPYLEKRLHDALSRYNNSKGSGRFSNQIERLVKEAYYGKVSVLFVARDKEVWGSFEPSGEKVEIHDQRMPCDVDLLDLVTALVLANRGEVYSLPAEKMPDAVPASAALRYFNPIVEESYAGTA